MKIQRIFEPWAEKVLMAVVIASTAAFSLLVWMAATGVRVG